MHVRPELPDPAVARWKVGEGPCRPPKGPLWGSPSRMAGSRGGGPRLAESDGGEPDMVFSEGEGPCQQADLMSAGDAAPLQSGPAIHLRWSSRARRAPEKLDL